MRCSLDCVCSRSVLLLESTNQPYRFLYMCICIYTHIYSFLQDYMYFVGIVTFNDVIVRFTCTALEIKETDKHKHTVVS